ncbi:hypothetical protein MSG28_012736 [Choristoneura fumiferana]|uniref:Uncharacterized protein n=1 Tax=Choristoneura fumiferana TaxID=7141 RepID=A0ACC0JHV9_CHOFU|nr:hypothetical protein MSG28_012736 [Choristoneura fumiferana]
MASSVERPGASRAARAGRAPDAPPAHADVLNNDEPLIDDAQKTVQDLEQDILDILGGLRVRRPPSHERTPPHDGRPRRARRPPAPGTRRRASTSAPGDSDFRPAEKLTHSMRSLPWWRRDYPAVAEPARCTRRLAPADDGLILGKDC